MESDTKEAPLGAWSPPKYRILQCWCCLDPRGPLVVATWHHKRSSMGCRAVIIRRSVGGDIKPCPGNGMASLACATLPEMVPAKSVLALVSGGADVARVSPPCLGRAMEWARLQGLAAEMWRSWMSRLGAERPEAAVVQLQVDPPKAVAAEKRHRASNKNAHFGHLMLALGRHPRIAECISHCNWDRRSAFSPHRTVDRDDFHNPPFLFTNLGALAHRQNYHAALR